MIRSSVMARASVKRRIAWKKRIRMLFITNPGSSYRTRLEVACVAIKMLGRTIGKKRMGTAKVFDFAYIVRKETIHPPIARSKDPITKTAPKSIAWFENPIRINTIAKAIVITSIIARIAQR